MKKLTYIIAGLLAFCTSAINAQSDSPCNASFEWAVYDGALPSVGGITFTNNATGGYTNLSWDFGDDNYSSNVDESVDHFYSEGGIYEVCLTVWNNQNCLSATCEEIEVSITDNSCDQADCVWPGDADGDGISNLYDLLTIGMGVGANGPQRINPSCEWEPQPCLDWDQETPTGVNYKHLDFNGDGTINPADLTWITCNYEAMQAEASTSETDGPLVKLDFDVDTIWINEDTPDVIEFSAGIMMGNSATAFDDIYGLALYLNYDANFLNPDEPVSLNYNENSFLGDTDNTEVIPYARDMRDNGQVDIAISRTDNQNTSGHGRIGTVHFQSDYVIVVDIIDGRTEKRAAFEVPIGGIKIINSDGVEIATSLSLDPSQIVFAQDLSTRTVDPTLADKITVFPNPANEVATVEFGDLEVSHLKVYNTLGQVVQSRAVTQNKNTKLSLIGLDQGIYTLTLQAEEGMISKRIIVK